MNNGTNTREQVISLMRQQKFEDALFLLKKLLINDTKDAGLLYMAGQCCRFLEDFKGAINYLKNAISINPREPSFFLALGIAQQLNCEFNEAIEAFRIGIEIYPDFDMAYNSLALTQKKMGDFKYALHNYDAGVKALTRRIVKNLNNSRSNKIIKHRDSRHNLWVEYASFGALYLCATNNIDSLAWPTGEQALEEETTERHAGLYWDDQRTREGKTVRLFLPNYFNTFGETLSLD